MTLAILNVATALPDLRLRQEEAVEIACRTAARTPEQQALVRRIYRQTGIRSRAFAVSADTVRKLLDDIPDPHDPFVVSDPASPGPSTGERMRLYQQAAPDLVCRAAQLALEGAGCEPAHVTQLITVSCTGFAAPGIDAHLIERLALSPSVQRTHIGFMGCHGALNGLRVAQALGQAADARVLLAAVELCSLHFCYRWDPGRMVGNALFADGAAALVGAAAPSANTPWQVRAMGSRLFPGSAAAMSWTIGDFGFDMHLSPALSEIIQTGLRPWLEGWLAEQGLSIGEVGSWAVHPGGPRILSAVEASLGLPGEALAVSREVLADHGNMSSPTLLFILERLKSRDARRPCVMLGFGPGVAAEVALLT